MKISNHRLFLDDTTPCEFRPSPNHSGSLEPKYLVMHYTAGRSKETSVQWLLNPVSEASAHLVIGRDGSITQMVPFNRKAWHAGASSWHGLVGLNHHAIGIELDNAGKLARQNDRWMPWFESTVPDTEVLVARHKNDQTESGWQIYTEAQLQAATMAAAAIIKKYNLRDVIGHDDISPFRKSDPGPAFQMESFRSKVMGRQEDELPVLVTTTTLNIRLGPSPVHDKLPDGPLPPNTRVYILQTEQGWCMVEVLDAINGAIGLRGWVNGTFLTLA